MINQFFFAQQADGVDSEPTSACFGRTKAYESLGWAIQTKDFKKVYASAISKLSRDTSKKKSNSFFVVKRQFDCREKIIFCGFY